MIVTIIEFSPSGNTNKVGEVLKARLEQNYISVQLVNIAGNKEYFLSNNKQKFLQETVEEHDILFIGSPVYAHHLQYHVKELIESLPKPINGWGKIAVPFVTYGGVSSGISLDEAGKLLRKSGRKVLAGMKVSSSHRMSRAFMDEEYNKDQTEDEMIAVIEELVKMITPVDLNSLKDNSKHLKYQNLETYFKANFIFKEKLWHEKRYPQIVIDNSKCAKFGKCTKVCPVCHLEQKEDKSVVKSTSSPCVHCFNCIVECPKQAIYPVGDLDKARTFMNRMISKGKENPHTCLYPRL